ncbi:hypothetical protein GJ744_001850 [Endocarpon pusillum]|uniref:Uncharacterized protein n=1 Tax=Endocarpon pusillum TaxID=364733 RepID=A0A8H7AQB4_9EURO|nr:hypothetical protein GJ744_001850 [Endocarpon pusillum]
MQHLNVIKRLFVSPSVSMPTPIPSNLSPLLKLPAPGSLTLITSVLDATSNWLLLRYIYAALRPEKQDGHATKAARVAVGAHEETTHDKNKDLKVIFISFLRPFELWREMGKKIGLDLPSLLSASNPRLIYIDAFTHLSYPASTPTPPSPTSSCKDPHPPTAHHSCNARKPPSLPHPHQPTTTEIRSGSRLP